MNKKFLYLVLFFLINLSVTHASSEPIVQNYDPTIYGEGYKPYTFFSGYFRDVISSKKLSPPRLFIDPNEASQNIGWKDYSVGRFGNQLATVPFELTLGVGIVTAVGVGSWHWGNTNFFFKNEGWFGQDTYAGGMDKLGHIYSTFLMADLLADRIRANSNDGGAGAEITAAAFSFGIMAGVEIFDGFTREYGFSPEDLTADVVGATFFLTRSLVPGLREKIDLRLLMTPGDVERSGVTAPNLAIGTYRRSRYILALKGSGFKELKDIPLRFFEAHFGYDARGFSQQEQNLGYTKESSLYFGLGVNLSEVIFGKNLDGNLSKFNNTEPAWITKKILEYYQIEDTSIYSKKSIY